MNIAIIGASIAGLACAEAALQNGHTVTLFDKGRGAGGRLSTRRASTDQGDLHFDHGTASFGVRTTAFRQQVEEWRDARWITEWTARHQAFDNGVAGSIATRTQYVGQPHMNSLVKALAETKDVHFSHRVSSLERKHAKWQISFDMGRDTSFECDHVVLAIPPEQAGELLETCHKDWSDQALACPSAAVWSVMLGYDTPLGLPFDTATITGSSLSAIYRNQTKPGRAPKGECLVLHATTNWSMEHLDDDPFDIARALETELEELTGQSLPQPVLRMSHRWKYGLNTRPLGLPFLSDADMGLSVCGDWLLGAGVEEAWLSGNGLGKNL